MLKRLRRKFCAITLLLVGLVLVAALGSTFVSAANTQGEITRSMLEKSLDSLCSEVALQEALAQTDALENLGTTIASDGRNTHLSHNLEQALLHSLDIVLLGCMIILLNLSLLYEVVEDGICQVWTEG